MVPARRCVPPMGSQGGRLGPSERTAAVTDQMVALCVKPEHMNPGARTVAGTVTRECSECGETVYVSPSTLAMMAGGTVVGLRCCCCADVHRPAALARVPHHTHAFPPTGDRVCSCGLLYATFRAELESAIDPPTPES